MKFKKIGLFSRHSKPGLVETLKQLISFLEKKNCNIILGEPLSKWFVAPAFPLLVSDQLMAEADLIIAVGGDGNLLEAARYAALHNIPVVGINQGTVGFLTDIKPADMEKELGEILDGNFLEEKRFLLETYAETKNLSRSVALNEIAWISDNPARMIEFEIFLQGELCMRERANGLIVATPTGSTAYALSAGGPVVYPSLDGLVLVPMFPQALARCPIVIPANMSIALHLMASSKAAVQVYGDSISCYSIMPDETAIIQKFPKPLKLLHPSNYRYFDTVKEKLKL